MQRRHDFGGAASRAACGPLRTCVVAAKAVVPSDIVTAAKAVVPAQAGIHVCASWHWWCRVGLPASRQAAPGVGSHRGGRCCARLPCGARPGVASRNSLRSLRSLRSDNRDENDNEARCARRPLGWPCRPRWASGPAARQAQTVHWTVCVRGSPPRRPRVRPRRMPPGATLRFWCSVFRGPNARVPQVSLRRRVRPKWSN